MNEELIVGLLALAVPLFGIGYLMLSKQAGIFRMYIAMLLIGFGYLAMTGALGDIGRKVLGRGEIAVPAAPVVKPAAAPAVAPAKPAAAPAATPAPAAPAPAAAPATPPGTPMPPAALRLLHRHPLRDRLHRESPLPMTLHVSWGEG